MILSILADQSLDMRTKVAVLLIEVVMVLLALTVHEASHGFVAYKLGDPTAKEQGRLTLNPLAHLDPFGFLMLLLVGFGYAKPVPVNMRRLQKPRRDMALVSLAGPLSNLLLALVLGLLSCLLAAVLPLSLRAFVLPLALQVGMQLNIGLALFNLIPIPPLDGSNILVSFLKPNAAAQYLKIRYYTQYIFLAIIAVSWLARYSTFFALLDTVIWYPLTVLRSWISNGILWLGGALFGFLS